MRAVEQVVDSGAFDCLQVHYSVLNPTAWDGAPAGSKVRDYRRIAARAAAAGLGVVALRVLEAGVLAERAPVNAATAAQQASLAAALGREPLSETAIRFVLSRPEVTTALVGFSSVAQVEAAAAAAARGPLSKTVLSRIEAWRAAAA
jgi:aryl-alcohol dehydrogenase-like predicted oxidoreductase